MTTTNARATREVIARANATAVRQQSARQLRRMARYVIDGWTPNLLRAVAAAADRAELEPEWIRRAIAHDADALAEYLAAQGLKP